ncbi:MAG: hypothetical protein HN742_01450 [Lentisphaerae bacterium]|nr:hypothetical protein [Lentisphaerota bacterium]MBT7054025.1 hypothetical protein [Lentisphaerota bacterium]MBT7840500.1 hypothetical protein [Lentisphaerota bacterium]
MSRLFAAIVFVALAVAADPVELHVAPRGQCRQLKRAECHGTCCGAGG